MVQAQASDAAGGRLLVVGVVEDDGEGRGAFLFHSLLGMVLFWDIHWGLLDQG
jgi:hypothetical protein